MWILLLIITGHSYFIERYDTRNECEIERDRVSLEMHKAYPDDTNLELLCRYKGKQA